MADPRLLVEVVPTATGEGQLTRLTLGLWRRLRADGDFAVGSPMTNAPYETRGADVPEFGRLLVEWGQAYGPHLAAGAAGALGTKIVESLVAALRAWLRDAGPAVDKAIIKVAEDVTLEITTNGADPEKVAKLAAAYAERLEATGE